MATAKQYYYGLGRRKSSTATSRLYAKGKGDMTVNGQPALEYFDGNEYIFSRLQKPFATISAEGQFDVTILTKGGGHSSQADAIILAVSRSLAEFNEDYRSTLKRSGLVKRDPREKERKKPGLKRARRAEQFSKR
ncbi:MAG: 30S ribosomal protein S9 [Candidatus Nomurabacteria bacterium]|nr:MAG: 30S ribosomal protein S9 [Candidatus Nomurabacteria bacterium]HRV76120.1 30S ribosomal protein S9 [Candidatus Saccharimonadales bacterium]